MQSVWPFNTVFPLILPYLIYPHLSILTVQSRCTSSYTIRMYGIGVIFKIYPLINLKLPWKGNMRDEHAHQNCLKNE